MKLQWRKAGGGGYVTFDPPLVPGKYVIRRSPRPGTSRTDWTLVHFWPPVELIVCDRLGEAKRYAQQHADGTWAP